jgi:hypothetical protein
MGQGVLPRLEREVTRGARGRVSPHTCMYTTIYFYCLYVYGRVSPQGRGEAWAHGGQEAGPGAAGDAVDEDGRELEAGLGPAAADRAQRAAAGGEGREGARARGGGAAAGGPAAEERPGGLPGLGRGQVGDEEFAAAEAELRAAAFGGEAGSAAGEAAGPAEEEEAGGAEGLRRPAWAAYGWARVMRPPRRGPGRVLLQLCAPTAARGGGGEGDAVLAAPDCRLAGQVVARQRGEAAKAAYRVARQLRWGDAWPVALMRAPQPAARGGSGGDRARREGPALGGRSVGRSGPPLK